MAQAAGKLRDLNSGSMPICGEDNRLKGMLIDRVIVVGCIAQGSDPSQVKVGEIGQGKPATIGADDDESEALRTMK